VIDDTKVRAPGPGLDAQDQIELDTMLAEIEDLLSAFPAVREREVVR
jgi:hypothetical protein